ncbi:unnamed protein product [Discula destructiva]
MPGMGKEFAPITLSSRRRKIIIIAGLFLTWSLAFITFSHDGASFVCAKTTSSSSSSSLPEWLPVKKLSCTDAFWVPEECGLDGATCEPFSTHHAAFQCPANCAREGAVSGKPHLAGGDEILGKPLVIGGPIYRGDSYICPTAVHAGVVDDATGGCGVAQFMGMTNSFPGRLGHGGIESIGVRTYFPLTFRFTVESEDLDCPAARKDGKWALLFVSAVHTALVWRATHSSAVRTVWALAVMYAHLRHREGAGKWMDAGLAPKQPAASTHLGGEVAIPQILEPVIFRDTISNATFKWATPVPDDIEGISMWIDDVERSRRYFGNGGKNMLKEGEQADSFVWRRTPQAFVDYIRFGYIKGGKVIKYSQPGIWFTNGTWTGIPPEPQAARAPLD